MSKADKFLETIKMNIMTIILKMILVKMSSHQEEAQAVKAVADMLIEEKY